MIKVFVVQSAAGHYYSKQGLWLSGKEAGLIYFGKFKDEALNQLIDITIKDVNVRAKVVETQLSHRRHPELEILIETNLIDSDKALELDQSLEQENGGSGSNVVGLKSAQA